MSGPTGGEPLDIAVLGAGHVGLVSAVCLAAIGHHVRVLDIDERRIERLAGGEVPFLEPGLDELLTKARSLGRISFHAKPDALPGATLVFLCVDTPNRPEGQVDLSSVVSATHAAAQHASDGAVIVNRSTAPVGTADYISSIIEERRGRPLPVIANPEFLAEGTAVRDFLAPDRIVIGTRKEADAAPLLEAYEPIVTRNLPADLPEGVHEKAMAGPDTVPVLVAAPPTAELIKYAANAFLAVKVSFINEIAGISEELGGDITEVARALGLDHRIGPHFLRAGIGWGGSCFPKDIVALQGMAETRGLSARMLGAANAVNADQRRWVIRKLQQHLKTLVGRRVGLLGLAYKPMTDDLRDAPSLEIAAELARLSVQVRGFDPAIKAVSPDAEGILDTVDGPLALAQGADALVLVTEWPEFRELDLAELARAMREPLILDGRNFLDPEAVRTAGFTYVSVGR
ncbi:MAG: UDP-glucose dehydrogenase family protein [Actinomycetota bacterium]